jgi:hypothetical protein
MPWWRARATLFAIARWAIRRRPARAGTGRSVRPEHSVGLIWRNSPNLEMIAVTGTGIAQVLYWRYGT